MTIKVLIQYFVATLDTLISNKADEHVSEREVPLYFCMYLHEYLVW